MSFFEFSERGVPQARRYFEQVSTEQGRGIGPKLSFGWLFLRATRLPFLTATFVPILLGIAVAGLRDDFSWWLALLTLLGGASIHLALNVANDIFDTLSGADEANVNPTQFSGGSRVILYGLLRLRSMVLLSAGFYAVGIGIGILLAALQGWNLLWLGVAGALISFFYTAPPLKLVHRGLGEIAVFLGFGPIMALGAYFVQAGDYAWEPFFVSIPVGILIALILYVNEVPDRPADASAGKRTLPVRLSKDAVVRLYEVAVGVTFGLIVAFALSGLIARPAIIAARSPAARVPRHAGAPRVLREPVRPHAGDGEEHPAPPGDRPAARPRLRDLDRGRGRVRRSAELPALAAEPRAGADPPDGGRPAGAAVRRMEWWPAAASLPHSRSSWRSFSPRPAPRAGAPTLTRWRPAFATPSRAASSHGPTRRATAASSGGLAPRSRGSRGRPPRTSERCSTMPLASRGS